VGTLSAMGEDATYALPLRRRALLRLGRHSRTWWQLARFVAVGASGYVVNLVTFAVAVHLVGLDYRVASVVASLLAIANNFHLNRHWTFAARHGHAGGQAWRFLIVSVSGLGLSLVVLWALVEVLSLPEVAAQALAVGSTAPFTFVGNKLWTFRAGPLPPPPPV
jgi:putative flippase GtrA